MSKKAQERIYFKNPMLFEQYRICHPNCIMTRFIKEEADITRSEWIGYDVQEQVESKAEQPKAEQQVPEVA